MIKPEELRKIADEAKVKHCERFVQEILPQIEKEMIKAANSPFKYELRISSSSELNKDNWLSEPNLYKSVIKFLEKEGYTVTHSDDVRDGTYMIIKW